MTIKIGPITLRTDLVQGSDEWHRLRAGSLGSSDTATAAGAGKTSDALLEAKIIAEATGIIRQGYSNGWMDRGTLLEPQAAEWLEPELRRIYAAVGIELIGYGNGQPEGPNVGIAISKDGVFPAIESCEYCGWQNNKSEGEEK